MTVARSIGAAQTIPVRGDVEANLQRHLRAVDAAMHARAQVLVFPELSLTGYELDIAERLAFDEADPRLAPVIEAATSCRMALIVGAPARIGARLHIGAFVIAPDGTVDVYTKRHLGAFASNARADGIVPPAEHTIFEPGDRDPLVRVGRTTGAVAVCADVNHPSHPSRAADRGAATYLASMFIIPSDLDADSARLRSYALDHGLAVVMANYGGPTGGLASGGGSAIWSPTGEQLGRLPGTGAGVAVAREDDQGWRADTILLGDD